MLDKNIGVYQIQNTVNGKIYVGSTIKGFGIRWNLHLTNLRSGKHHSQHLQSAFNKYGEESFCFSILEVVKNPKECIPTEQRFINLLHPEYNMCLIAGSYLGMKHTPEAKVKMHAAQLGNKKNLGKKLSEETKAKIQDSKKWYHPTEETKLKISKSLQGRETGRKGIPLTEETKAKMSLSMKGRAAPNKNKPMSEEQRKKLSGIQIANTNKAITIMGRHKTSSEVVYFTSAKAAERAGYGDHSMICKCCNGKRKTCHGYIWSYV